MKILKIVLLFGLAAGCSFAQAAINSVTLTWTWAQGSGVAASGFNIYRASSAAGPYTQIGTVAATATAYTDSTTASAPAGTSWATGDALGWAASPDEGAGAAPTSKLGGTRRGGHGGGEVGTADAGSIAAAPQRCGHDANGARALVAGARWPQLAS